MQPVNDLINTEKAPVRVMRFDELVFAPRFEYGEMADVAGVCGAGDGSELGAGWGRFRHARIPWTIRYDEVLTVFEGELLLHVGDEVHRLRPRDCIWLPAGTELIYEADSALVHFAIHPSNWQETA
jgi:ethanolamine utilization protein EutQ